MKNENMDEIFKENIGKEISINQGELDPEDRVDIVIIGRIKSLIGRWLCLEFPNGDRDYYNTDQIYFFTFDTKYPATRDGKKLLEVIHTEVETGGE